MPLAVRDGGRLPKRAAALESRRNVRVWNKQQCLIQRIACVSSRDDLSFLIPIDSRLLILPGSGADRLPESLLPIHFLFRVKPPLLPPLPQIVMPDHERDGNDDEAEDNHRDKATMEPRCSRGRVQRDPPKSIDDVRPEVHARKHYCPLLLIIRTDIIRPRKVRSLAGVPDAAEVVGCKVGRCGDRGDEQDDRSD